MLLDNQHYFFFFGVHIIICTGVLGLFKVKFIQIFSHLTNEIVGYFSPTFLVIHAVVPILLFKIVGGMNKFKYL